MTEPHYPQRKSPRLQGYDYSQAGVYFVTLCTYGREHLFGEVENGEIHLNAIGEIAAECWLKQTDHFPHIELDGWVVMPNHLHGIVLIDHPVVKENGRAVARPYTQLGKIINVYKGAVTMSARRIPDHEDIRIWQGRYHDHIIRNEQDYHRIAAYVEANPQRWAEDTFYS